MYTGVLVCIRSNSLNENVNWFIALDECSTSFWRRADKVYTRRRFITTHTSEN